MRVGAPLADSLAEGIRGESRQLPGGIRDALEELGNDRARIAAGAVEQGIGNGGEKRTQVLVAGRLQNAQG